ncbi:MAG: RagB/SusD family nutrient uptake outer membrane protein [Bacteroidaceae bacterium]
MKNKFYTIIVVASMLVSCAGELDQTPNTETTSADVYTSVANYKAVLAKLYASFVICGQEKGGGNADISSNSGYDYMRCYFNLQEAGTDELASTWLEGDNMTNISYLSWDDSDPWVSDTYYHIYYTITLCNEFLRNSTDNKISSFTTDEQTVIRQYAAEARFLRALAYYHAMDLYRNIPFVTETDPVGAYTPPRYTASQIFSYIESELKDIEDALPDKNDCVYGHAPKAAAWALLAKLYLNAEVYTGEDHYTDCITYCNKIIKDGYSLNSNYQALFNADNNKRTNEIIFPLCVDAEHTMSWGATTYIVCGAMSSTSDYENPADYGVTSGWGSFRVRGEISALFEDGDQRALFFTEGQTQYLDELDNQSDGYLVTKWTNLTDAGETASNTGSDGVDTDYPMFRLSDVYLMLAESVLRGGTGATKSDALGYVNTIRERAYGSTAGNINDNKLTLSFILNERGRELYWECTRRTDLIRYGEFTTSDYIWQWKGGVKDGTSVDSKYNIYPIPATELSANPNLHNENY